MYQGIDRDNDRNDQVYRGCAPNVQMGANYERLIGIGYDNVSVKLISAV